MPPVHLLPLGAVPPGLIDHLVETLSKRIDGDVVIDPPAEPDASWLDAARGQYDAGRVLAGLVADPPADGGWRVALLPGDLFAPGLESAFGLATLGGCCAVIALARLDPTFEGGPPDDERFFRRVATEALHELGHIAGRDHCPDPACVMHYSTTAAEVDRKTLEFCAQCAG